MSELATASGARLATFPGRTVGGTGPSAKWLFIDSWYILGPFDNTNRANIARKFPPETVVDLNASYPGKLDLPIKWEFHQATQPCISPPLDGWFAAVQKKLSFAGEVDPSKHLQYIIYYAYTELKFDRDCDLWVAIGSDDFSRLWINEQPVWSSGKKLKAWRIDEGMRKVHFNKGVNKVLFRVENANNITGFSLCVSLQP